MWKYYALLSAVFAALTAILAKCGVKNVDSNLATAIWMIVILFLTWSIVLFTGGINHIRELSFDAAARRLAGITARMGIVTKLTSTAIMETDK